MNISTNYSINDDDANVRHIVIKTLDDHISWVNYLVVLPDKSLASCSADTTVKIWDTINGNVIKTYNDHTGSVWSLVVLPDNTLASSSQDTTINITRFES